MNGMMTRVEAAGYEELPVRTGKIFRIGNKEVVLFRLTNGNIRAIENRSPHPKGGTLSDGLVSGEYVFCPLYDWKISLMTGKVQAPDEGKVKTYPVEIDEGRVYIIV